MKPADDFDWVKARFACSPFVVFQQLQLGCERDVKTRNELASSEPAVFKTVAEGDVFLVLREGRTSASVEFSWSPAGIAVRRDFQTPPFLAATLTLNDDGECRLKVGDDELSGWQFRKRALEDLLFRL